MEQAPLVARCAGGPGLARRRCRSPYPKHTSRTARHSPRPTRSSPRPERCWAAEMGVFNMPSKLGARHGGGQARRVAGEARRRGCKRGRRRPAVGSKPRRARSQIEILGRGRLRSGGYRRYRTDPRPWVRPARGACVPKARRLRRPPRRPQRRNPRKCLNLPPAKRRTLHPGRSAGTRVGDGRNRCLRRPRAAKAGCRAPPAPHGGGVAASAGSAGARQ